MLSKFFIDRPVFANVIAIITVLIGGVALWGLSIEQYPEITPPTIRVTTTYPGANSQTVADTVAAPIEQQVNGVENMLYMSSTSSGDGSYSLTVTFEIGTDLDEAQVLVQNRVAIAQPQLPEEVRRQGVIVKKQSTSMILVIALYSDDPSMDTLFLSNYATLRLRDELSRVRGVGEVTVFGTANYSMRIWLDAEKLKTYQMTAGDVVAALQEQNAQVAAGQVGQPPSREDISFQYAVTVLGRLSDPAQFEQIVVKSGEGTNLVYLKDIARVELGSQSYDQFTEKEGQPNANIGIYQLPGANALQVAEDVKATLERLSGQFPQRLHYSIPLDTTIFVSASIHEVYKTLIEAGVLVLIVILVFLQDWRAVLIPATTVPVTIIGAFSAMYALGFSVNMLTLFGLVLAIGIVVDDAIVVVENAVHHIERGESPRIATIRAMDEVLGPIIGITLVLLAVFIPAAMLGGITGQLYRQFALTIAATALISAINAVTLKPTQCALWLRPVSNKPKWFFFRWFEAVYGVVERIYTSIVQFLVRHVVTGFLVFAILLGTTVYWYLQLPTGFIPTEDQGYMLIAVQLPDAASQQRTREVMADIDSRLSKVEGLADRIAIGGLSLLDQASASNAGTYFITFDSFEERMEKGITQDMILENVRKELASLQSVITIPFAPPAIRGLGVRSGFEMLVEDRQGVGLQQVQQMVQEILRAAEGQSGLSGVSSTFRPGVPQLYANVDREKAKVLNVPLGVVFGTLQSYLGSAYVNDFNKFGRTYQVRVQADQKFRETPGDISRLEVRNTAGEMLPLGTLVTVTRSFGPQTINRYNLYPSATISGASAPGYSSGDALRIMEQIAQQTLPGSMGYEWTGMAYQEQRVGGESLYIFAVAIILVYLVLAAQYESWILPIAVILVVPLGLLGAVIAVSVRGMDNNVYTQIGIVLIIALASKNAILIVEFARELRAQGKTILEASVQASQMRFRPIVMTSFAFILGVVPLVLAHGAGAVGQRALGTAVFGGMLASTCLAVFFIPIFYVIFQWVDEKLRGHAPVIAKEGVHADPESAPPAADH